MRTRNNSDNRECGNCMAIQRLVESNIEQTKQIDKLLLSEIDKPKLWDGAPDNAVEAYVQYSGGWSHGIIKTVAYSRKLPKSPAREIAEANARKYSDGMDPEYTVKCLADAFEATINEWEARKK